MGTVFGNFPTRGLAERRVRKWRTSQSFRSRTMSCSEQINLLKHLKCTYQIIGKDDEIKREVPVTFAESFATTLKLQKSKTTVEISETVYSATRMYAHSSSLSIIHVNASTTQCNAVGFSCCSRCISSFIGKAYNSELN